MKIKSIKKKNKEISIGSIFKKKFQNVFKKKFGFVLNSKLKTTYIRFTPKLN